MVASRNLRTITMYFESSTGDLMRAYDGEKPVRASSARARADKIVALFRSS
jgi:hypothetical protein